ncbi:MAG: multidrug transporter AcrB [Hirschia sp.]|nr:multidrug transporter AcrB [Hirschia sp.]MBF19786.1 multidrug transporter AcrB [Hirschia sp.]
MSSDSKGGLPELAVKRPLLVTVFNLLIVIAGLAALMGIEVRELPDVDRPVVSVRASMPGGAPETMDAEVTSVLEGAAARVSGVREINASSEENSSRMNIEFNPGVDLDIAASDVREAISQVSRQLPDRVENVFVTKADQDGSAIVTLAVTSDTLSLEEMTRIIDKSIAPEILTVDGVASVQEYGVRERQMRVVLDPLRLSRFGLTVSDVAGVLRDAPFDVPVGSFQSDDQELIVRAEATAATPELIKAVNVAENVTVGDVAEVVLGPADAENLLQVDGETAIGLGVVRRAQSNTIKISDAVAVRVAELNEQYDNLHIEITADDAVFIRRSVEEVVTSLMITVLIVVATIWIFLGSAKATIVPSIAIPVALIGTLAGIWVMGFSINLLTLLALVLATGLIVDDAIVVLENIQRQQSLGLGRKAAAVVGARQVFFAVIATTAVLVAVFVPISFLPSTTGRLFREFGFVLAFSVIISSFVALTLAPAIAARFHFNSDDKDKKPGVITRVGKSMANAYGASLKLCLGAPIIVAAVCLVAAGGAVFAYNQIDSELVPSEDRGRVIIFATGPDGVGLSYMERQADEIQDRLRPLQESGEIASVFTIVGRFDPNRVWTTATLVPWSERTRSQDEIIASLRGPMSEIPGANVSVFGRSSLQAGGGNRSGLRLALMGADYESIYEASRTLTDAVSTRSKILSNPEISYQPTQPQLSIKVDRTRAADLDISLDEISITLQAMVGGEDLTDLNVGDEAIPIILESETSAIQSPMDLHNLFVRSNAGDLVPLSSLTTMSEEGVAAELDRVEQRRAIDIDMDIASGVALADAVTEIKALAAEVLPDGITMILRGEADTLQETSHDMLLTFGFAIVIVFLVLVAQFESLTSPIVVMLIVPFGLAAAIYAMLLSGTSLNIYSQIGLVLLIGLMAKNGILLVEFADQLRAEGRSVREAAFEAATVRVRPIAMTVLSTALGALPLILSSGAGAEARLAIGWVIFGGLGLAAIFTLYLAPVLYLWCASLSRSPSASQLALEDELAQIDGAKSQEAF